MFIDAVYLGSSLLLGCVDSFLIASTRTRTDVRIFNPSGISLIVISWNYFYRLASVFVGWVTGEYIQGD